MVSGHSLGGAMADLFAIVDGERFAALSGSDLAIVSLASPGLDPDVITDDAGGFGFNAEYNRTLVMENEGDIVLQNPAWFSQYYFGFSHDLDRVYYAEKGEADLQEHLWIDFNFTANFTLGGNENFAATTLNLPNITNGQVTYKDDYGQDKLLLPFFEHGFGADHNGLIYWRNVHELTASPLYAEYAEDSVARKIAFGVGIYADQRWFTGGPIDERGTHSLLGTGTGDFLLGLEGNDVLDARAGDDLLDGGMGNDELTGGSGGDSLFGGIGDDTLSGGSDVDYLMGGAGDDVLDGGTGVNTFAGGWGNDTYIIDSGSEFATITENAGEGTDTLEIAFQGSMIFAQTINLGGALDAIENATIAETVVVSTFGGSNPVNALAGGGLTRVSPTGLFNLAGNGADNVLTGNGRTNIVEGGAGNDALYGLGGSDTLNSGDGNDLLQGGAGGDFLTGGADNDRFIFTSKLVGDADRITDFTEGDLLILEGGVFTGLGAGGALTPGAFVQGTVTMPPLPAGFLQGPVAMPSAQLLYDAAQGYLYYDADGYGIGAKVLVAALTDHPVLDAGDFWVA